MKIAPTDLDRQAAELFTAAPGVRVAYARGNEPLRWGRYVSASDRLMLCSERSGYSVVGADAVAFDTDDDATKGVMLAQVREMAGDPHIATMIQPCINGVFWLVGKPEPTEEKPYRFTVAEMGDTEPAALVAAKRALAAPETA